jgi:hypothetical protein
MPSWHAPLEFGRKRRRWLALRRQFVSVMVRTGLNRAAKEGNLTPSWFSLCLHAFHPRLDEEPIVSARIDAARIGAGSIGAGRIGAGDRHGRQRGDGRKYFAPCRGQ